MIKSIKTKLKFTALATLVVTLICCVFFAFAGFGNNGKTANATASGVNVALDSDGQITKDGYENLLHYLSGTNGTPSYELVKNRLDGNVLTGSQINASVTLGGYTWNVVYASETRNGEVIATLWLAESSDTHQWNNWYVTADADDWKFPYNMYSTSFVRSYLIGNIYASSTQAGAITNTSLVSIVDGTQSTAWANFLSQYGNYIVAPTEVEWQENESISYHNETYSSQTTDSYASKPGYGNWQYDKLWLPSQSEVGAGAGDSVDGLWGITGTVRSNTIVSWLRTSNLAGSPRVLHINGTSDSAYATDAHAVRPALHLNLAKINEALSEEKDNSLETAWNNAVEESLSTGTQVTFTLEKDWYALSDANYTTSFGSGTGFSEGRIYIPAGANILLDLNGYTINRGLTSIIDNGNVFYVEGALEINDTSASQHGIITGGNTSFRGGGIWVYNKGSLTLSGGTIANNTAGLAGGVYCAGGTFIMNGGAISANIALHEGGGAYCLGGTFIMNDGKITGNKGSMGGALHFNAETIIINGGEISGNAATANGGGISMNGSSAFTMADGKIFGNVATYYGGGIYAAMTSVLEMTGGVIGGDTEADANTATTDGGGVYLSASTLIMNGGEINGNTSNGGGGIASTSNCTIELNAGSISKNRGTVGGIRLYGTLTINGGTISGNIAGIGGGIALGSNSHILMYGGEISGNTASNGGGGVYLYNDDTFTMYGGEISGNTASYEGGGVYCYGYIKTSFFIMNGGTISGNTAKTEGGGIALKNTVFTMNGGTISNNKDSADDLLGGGVCLYSSSTFEMNDGEIKDNSAYEGGGVYVRSGNVFTMNGGTISGNSAYEGGGVDVGSGGVFTMNGGTISGNTSGPDGAGVAVVESEFIMNGGEIINHQGQGVWLWECTLKMNGGTITGNTMGVRMNSSSLFYLSGGVIANNKSSSGTQNNVYLEQAKINIAGVLAVAGKNATRVGITKVPMNTETFTVGYTSSGNSVTNAAKFFFSDANYTVTNSSGEIGLTPTVTSKSTITWVYQEGNRTPVTLTGSYYAVEYNGSNYTLRVNTGSIQYAVDENGATVGTTVSKVGKYYFTVANAENYYNPIFTFEILPQNIESAEINVVSSYLYNGNAIIPELSVTLGGKHLTEGVDFTASYADNVNAGTAKILIVGKGDYKGLAEGTFTIEKRNLNIRWGNTEAEYSGTVKSITAVVEGLLSGETVKLTLAYEQDGKTVSPVNAGEYLVRATITSGNYVLAPNADVTCTFTIKPRYISVVWSGSDLVYNGEEQQPEAHYVNAYGTTVHLIVTVDGSPVNVSEYTATATAAQENSNYILANTTYKFNIIKATADIEWSDSSLTFDGADKTPTATVTGIGGEDLSASVALAYYKDGKLLDSAPVNVGKYVVKATLSHDNYELEIEHEFVISAAQMTVNSEYADNVFTGEGKAPEITATFNSEELDIKVTYALAGRNEYSEELPVNVGNYVAKITEVNGNFVDQTVSFTITKANIAIVWSLDELSVKVVSSTKTTYQWLYDGKAHAPVATATFNGVELELNVEGITAIGTYSVTAEFKDNQLNNNFVLTNVTANIEIVRSTISEVRWYENGATLPLENGEKPSYKYIAVYGTDGPKLAAYGAANLTGLDDAGESITVTALLPLDVSYPEFVRNGFWAAREEAYSATASLPSVFAPYCDMKTTETSVEFYVTELTADEGYADVRWVVEVDGEFIDINEYEFTYNGSVQSPKAIVVIDADRFAADPTDLTSFAYLPIGGAMSDAGTYYAYILPCKYLIAEDDAECLFTIKPLDVTITWQVGEYTYNGTAQAPAARVSGTGGLACQVSVAGFVNAGNHVAIAVVDKNFNIVEGATQEFTIEKLNLAADRVEWGCDESGAKREDDFFVWNYDGELHLPTATMKVKINGETVEVALAVTGSASSVGTHYAFAILSNTDKNNSNYAFAGAKARFDIVLDTISHIYWSDEDAEGNIYYTYDGESHLPTAYYMNGSTRVDLTVIGERTEAGTYFAYVTDNFDFAVSTKHEFTILPQSLNVIWSKVEVTYTGSEQRPVVRFTDEDGLTVYLEAEEYSITGFIGAGEYTAEIFSLNGNYTFVNANSDYTIKAVEITLTWLGNDDGTLVWDYDGEKHVPTVSHSVNGVTVEVIGGESGVGVYTAVAVCDNENYVITNPTQEYEIRPFAITVVWTVGDYTYDGESYFAPTASYVDWNGDEHALTVNGARTDAGEYTAEAVLPENCTFKFESGENAGTHPFEIKRLLLTEISWTGNIDGTFVWVFDGEAHCPTAEAGTVKIAITGGAVNAGEYVATAEPANYQNYAFAEGVEVEKTFKIIPKTVDVKWYGENGGEDDDFIWEYDGTLRVPTAKFAGVDGNLISVPVNGATANSGEHQAIAIDVFNNYDFSKLTVNQIFKVIGKEVTAEWTVGADGTFNEDEGVYEFVFNGKAQQPLASAEGVNFAYTIKDAEGNIVSAAINAGEYTVTAITTNSNYIISSNSEVVKVKIKPVTKTVTWGNKDLSYTGEVQAPEAWFVDVNGQQIMLSVSGGKTDAGENYTANVSFDNGNYVLENDSCTFNIVANSVDGYYWDWEANEWKAVTGEPETPDAGDTDGSDGDGSDVTP